MMNKPLLKLLGCCLLVAAGILFGVLLPSDWLATDPGGNSGQEPPAAYDDSSRQAWDPAFQVVEISSSIDGQPEKAIYFRSGSAVPRPLVVSLHTWSGDYTQADPLALLCKSADLNYIHPDFRGPNWTTDSCCSDLALNDIDDSIDYALSRGSVDPSRICVIGVSGGGYATLAMFMKSRHQIRKFSAWVPISDLSAWYEESRIRGNKYAEDILACTGSEGGILDSEEAGLRSPLQWDTPPGRLEKSELAIHAGVYDGIQGSVPITHSINFYNKVLGDLYPDGRENEVTIEDKARLLEHRKPLGEFGTIGGRTICLEKSHGNLKLVIFTGNHEMLPEAAVNSLRLTIDD